jgi:1,4-dihydroxy-2-naphthoate octaprenyltransferase
MNPWIIATRPWSLVASAAPVLIGTALAVADGTVYWEGLVLLFLCAGLIQISSNLINDLEDHKRGADVHRVGPIRAVSSGLIAPSTMRNVALGTIGLAFVLGLPLVAHAGWEVLAIGIICLVAAWAYTGGPYPFAYHALGDAAAFVFFGVLAVTGTYFVHATAWSADAVILSIGPGLLAANILNVNNIRDIPTDTAAGKITLAVKLGDRNARLMYGVFAIVALIGPSAWLASTRGPWLWLPAVLLPYGIILAGMVRTRHGRDLQAALGGTAVFYLLYAILMSTALAMSTS